MPIETSLVGSRSPSLTAAVDRRWTMAYACGLGDHNPLYLDSEANEHTLAHPVFPVCLEWPVLLAMRASAKLEEGERLRAVHASHDLHLHRPISAGAAYTTSGRVVSVQATRAGAAQITRLDTVDDAGRRVCTTWQGTIFRGVAAMGDLEQEAAPEWPNFQPVPSSVAKHVISISAGAGNIYTECARIYNPIHSDRAMALAAGLPGPILHGTATLAHAVTTVIDQCLDGQADRVRRLGGQFSAMVAMPSEIEVAVDAVKAQGAAFSVLNSDGAAAVSKGFVCWGVESP